MIINLYEDGTDDKFGLPLQGESGRAYVISFPGGHGTITSFTKTIAAAGTAERLIGSSTPCKRVMVFFPTSSNGDLAAVGDSSVSAVSGSEQGALLYKASVPTIIEINDLTNLFGDVNSNGGRICGVYLS